MIRTQNILFVLFYLLYFPIGNNTEGFIGCLYDLHLVTVDVNGAIIENIFPLMYQNITNQGHNRIGNNRIGKMFITQVLSRIAVSSLQVINTSQRILNLRINIYNCMTGSSLWWWSSLCHRLDIVLYQINLWSPKLSLLWKRPKFNYQHQALIVKNLVHSSFIQKLQRKHVDPTNDLIWIIDLF